MAFPKKVSPRRKTHVHFPLPYRQDGIDTLVQPVEILLAGYGKNDGKEKSQKHAIA